MRVVLGVAGGIAAYKACSLLRLFTEAGHDVTVVPTAAALKFVGVPTWSALSGKPVHTDVWSDITEVPHVRIGQQADLVIVAPATADLLARAAAGQADDLLTNVLLTARCPVVMAPAMHTEMWDHLATQANVATLSERGVHIVPPAAGRLTGKDTGPGRLPEPEELFGVCQRILAHGIPAVSDVTTPVGPESAALTVPITEGRLRGQRVVVSAGGTREPLDPVRFLGNRSSGKQGYAVAAEAARRGAEVTLVSSAALPTPDGVELVAVETALEMREVLLDAADSADVVVMAAAVADFRPEHYVGHKIKKTHDAGVDGTVDDSAPELRLVRNPDILAELVRLRGDAAGPVIVGFAAETGDDEGTVLEHGRAKLARKGCDVLVVNEVGPGVAFGQEDNTVHLLLQGSSRVVEAGPAPKAVIAAAIWDLVETLV